MLENKANIVPEDLKGNKRLVKFNIPENLSSYKSGNGEGCWGYIEDDETYDQYDKGVGQFNIILLNDCWEYPVLKYGTVCLVDGLGDKRPVVNWKWLKEAIKEKE